MQKYRLSLEENKIPQQFPETGWSSLSRPSPFLGMNNGFIAPTSLRNWPAVYPVQDNQYQNGYLAINNNQFVTNNMPGFPYSENDHHLQQQHQQRQYQLSNHVMNYMMRNEPQQAYNSIGLTDLEPNIYPSLPYDPNEFLFDGYNFSNWYELLFKTVFVGDYLVSRKIQDCEGIIKWHKGKLACLVRCKKFSYYYMD